MKESKQSNGQADIMGERPAKNEFLITGIGASAGGIQALKEFFEQVPADSDMAYVVILHLSPDHDSQLANVLQAIANIPVTQVTEKVHVEKNHVYVVPPNHHLEMLDGSIIVSRNITVQERRAPVDIFFRTLAESHDSRAVAVILSGTGANGSMGIKRVKEKGGVCFVQNPREAEFNEMPRNSIATGLVDDVLPVRDIPAKIIAYKNSLGKIKIPEEPVERPEEQQQALREIFTQLRMRTGHDFSNYKRPTLLRRIERRVNVRNLATLSEYAVFLREHPEETQALLKDLLISVTNFFRDTKTFDYLQHEVIPRVLTHKTSESQIRVWVPGCATGEEAYSLAMLFTEQITGVEVPKIQIFATDIDEAAIAIARDGLYTINDAADVSPERLHRFFTKEGNEYCIRREIREMVLFARHNAIKDPPFSHLDMISCRNLLIYLNQVGQERLMETFHFALETGGYLVLGMSETVDGSGDLYTPMNREYHVYRSRQTPARVYPVPESVPQFRFERTQVTETIENKQGHQPKRISYGDLHGQLLEQYAPPSVVINEEYEIMHVSQHAGNFLQVAGGEPSQNLLKLVRPELRLELRSALYQSQQLHNNVEIKNLKTNGSNGNEIINIHVRPVLQESDAATGYILVLFEPAEIRDNEPVILPRDEPVARQLEEEIIRIKAQLRTSVEQYETQTEELKASNEELQAMNEELRSATEELETSKEELQSINEELITVNQELKIKVEEISHSGNNLQNLINSADIGTIFLDRSFRVNMFTPSANEIFNLIPNDYGRPLSDITHRLIDVDLQADAETVISRLTPVEREVETTEGKSYLMRVLPYRTAEDRINGVVVTFVNITSRRSTEQALRKSEERLRITMESAADYAIITTNTEGITDRWNLGAERIFGYTANEVTGKPADIIFTEEDKIAGTPAEEMRMAQEQGRAPDERWHIRKDGSRFFMSGVMRPIYNPELTGYVKVARDMTEQKQAEENLRIWEERYRIALQSAEMAAWDWNVPEDKITWNEQHHLLLGLKPEKKDINAAYFLHFVHEEDLVKIKNALQVAVEKTGVYHAEFRIKRADNGEVRWMNGFGRAVTKKNDRATRMVGVMFEITERKKLEQQKDDFISIASHELKTPVTSIKAYAEILHQMFEEAEDVSNAALIKKLDTQVDRLIELIHALLDTTRINEGELALKPEKFDLNELVTERVEDLQRLSSIHSIVIAGKEVIITADRERLGQVITNLISNAIKYSPKGGDITVHLDDKGDNVELSVHDKGIGISAEMQKKVFDRFFRIIDAQLQNYPGMGLGLYITANIIHRHNGKIWVENNPGGGSAFYISIPKTL